MIIDYNSEIAYWKHMNLAGVNRDFTGITYLGQEFFTAMQEKLFYTDNKKEREKIHNDLRQILIFCEHSKKFQLLWAKEMQDLQNNDGDEWKLNG